MLPAAIFLLGFLTYPLGLGVWLGFTDTRIGRAGDFIGLQNYAYLMDDQVFWLSVFNTVVYTLVASILKFALGLWLALILNENCPSNPSSAPSCCCHGWFPRCFRRSPSGGSTMRSFRSSPGR